MVCKDFRELTDYFGDVDVNVEGVCKNDGFCPYKLCVPRADKTSKMIGKTVDESYCRLKCGIVVSFEDNTDVNRVLNLVSNGMKIQIEKLETILSLPMDYIKSSLSETGLTNYIKLRQQLIHALEMVEVLVYDTHEDAPKCMFCGAKAEIVYKPINGVEQEVLNGEISHWLQNGKIMHDFTCDACMKGK